MSTIAQEVYLSMSNTWSEILHEDGKLFLAKDVDGVNVYVIKDHQAKVRNKE